MAKIGGVDLLLPAILYFDGGVTVNPELGFKARGIRFLDERTMVCKEHSIDERPGWLIESDGNFREVFPTGKRREWARPMKFLWRFTLSEFEVTLPRQITAGDVYERTKVIKERSREAPIVTDLRRFMRGFGKDDVVTREMLLAWPI